MVCLFVNFVSVLFSNFFFFFGVLVLCFIISGMFLISFNCFCCFGVNFDINGIEFLVFCKKKNIKILFFLLN